MLNNRMKGAYYHTYQVKLASKANVMALIDELKSYYEVLMKLLNETNDRIDHDREVMKEKLNAIYNKLLHMQFILTKFNDEIDLAIAEKLQNLMEHFETGIVDMIQQYDCNLFNHNLFTGVEEGEELKLEDSEIYDRSIFHIGTELGFRWFGGKISSKRVMTELDNCFRLTKATNLGMKKTEDYINSNPIIELFIYGPRGMSWLEIGQNATFGYNVVIKYNSLKDNLKATLRSEDYTVPREFDTNVLDINIIFDMLYDANDNLKEDTYIKVKTNLPAASFGGIPQYFLSDAKSTSDYADAKAVKNSDVRVLNENNRDVSYAKDFNDSVEDFYKKQPEVIITSQTFRHKDNKSTDKELLENMTSMDGVIEAKLDSADTVKISSIVKRTDQNDEFGGVDALHSGITLGELGKDAYQDEEYFTDKQDLINESMEPNSSPLYNSGDQNIDLFDYRDLGTVSLITKNENMFGVDNAMHNSPVVVNNNEDYGDFKNDKGLRNKIINDSLLDVLSDNEFYEDKPAKVSEMGHVILENENGETTVGENIKITGVYETSAGTFASSNAGVYKWDDNYSKFVKTNITKGNWGKIFSTPDGNVWFLSLDNDGIYKLDRTITDSNANPQLVRTNVVTGTFTDAIVTKTGDFFALCSESNHNFDPITSKYKINALVWVYTDGNLCEYSDYLVKKYNDDSLDCVINEEIATKLTGGSYKVWHLPLIDTFYILNLKSKTLFKSAVGIFGDFSIAIPNEVSNYQDGYVTIDGKIQKMTADGNFSKVYTKTTTEINGLKNVVNNHVVTDMNLEDLNYNDDETDAVEIPDGTVKVLDDEMFAIPENLSYSVKEYEEVIKKTYQLIYDTILNDGTKKETVMLEKTTPFHRDEARIDDTYISDFKERKVWLADQLVITDTKTARHTAHSAIYFKNNKTIKWIQGLNNILPDTDSVYSAWGSTSYDDLKFIFNKYTINGVEKNRHIIYKGFAPIQKYNYGSSCSWIYDRNAINYNELVADLNRKIAEKVNELYADKTVKYHWIYALDIKEDTARSRSVGNRVIEGFNNFKVEKIRRFYPHNQNSTYKNFAYIVTVSDDVVSVKPSSFAKSGLTQEISVENVKFDYIYNSSTELDVNDLEGFYNNHIVEYNTIAEADLYDKNHTAEVIEAYNERESKKIYGPTTFNVYDLDNPSCALYDETFNYGDSLDEFKQIVKDECSIVVPLEVYDYGEYMPSYSSYPAFSKPQLTKINYKNKNYWEVYKAEWEPGVELEEEISLNPDAWNCDNPAMTGIDNDSDGIFEEFDKPCYRWAEYDWNIKSRIENTHSGYEKNEGKTLYVLNKKAELDVGSDSYQLIFQHNGNLPFVAWTRRTRPTAVKGITGDPKYGPYILEKTEPNLNPLLLTHYISDDSDECIKRHLCESGPYTFCKSIDDMMDEDGFYNTERYKRMNYLEFFKNNGSDDFVKNAKSKFEDLLKYYGTFVNKYFYYKAADATILKLKGTDKIFGQFFECSGFRFRDTNPDHNKYFKLIKNNDKEFIDGEIYTLIIDNVSILVAHPAFDNNGKFALDFELKECSEEKDGSALKYELFVDKGSFDKYFDDNGIFKHVNFFKDFFDVIDPDYYMRNYSIEDDNHKVVHPYLDENDYLIPEKVKEFVIDNYGFYISSYITDFDEQYKNKNHDFNAYDRTKESYSEEIILGSMFNHTIKPGVVDNKVVSNEIIGFSFALPVTTDPNTGNLREILGYTGEYTVGTDANHGGSYINLEMDKSIELMYKLELENGEKNIITINDIPTACQVVNDTVSADSKDFCLAVYGKTYTPGLMPDGWKNGYYVEKKAGPYYWHDDEPEEHYPEATFHPRTINTPEYTEKDVEYNRPNGVLDIQFCNGYFYILLNNDHIYKFDANLTLVGIINCNNASSIYVNSNVLFIQDKDGNIFTDRESIKRHPSLYKTNLFYRKKNGEVIELNTKIVAHAQDR